MELLGAEKLLLEDIHIPDELLDGKRRHFAALPILIANAGGAWVRPIVWDTRRPGRRHACAGVRRRDSRKRRLSLSQSCSVEQR